MTDVYRVIPRNHPPTPGGERTLQIARIFTLLRVPRVSWREIEPRPRQQALKRSGLTGQQAIVTMERMGIDIRNVILYDMSLDDPQLGDPTEFLASAGNSCCSCGGIERLWDECRWCGTTRCYYCRYASEIVCEPAQGPEESVGSPRPTHDEQIADLALEEHEAAWDRLSEMSDDIEWEEV